ncbi:MAG: tripartite tricarboxylate transporter substrate binding protein [Betaproteobacteria bacterium]|nr:tripartite tricarboxylate transporter substrate binding protein [Betaproteobacteria bacterium]
MELRHRPRSRDRLRGYTIRHRGAFDFEHQDAARADRGGEAGSRQTSLRLVRYGGATHIASELFLQTAGVSMTHVPYKGNGDAVVGAITGVIDMLLTSVPTAMGQVRSGKLTALAVTSKTRVPALKDVPTAAEAGFEFDLSNWYGILAPAGTSTQHVEYLVQKVRDALQTAQVKEAFAAQGAEPVIMSTAEQGRIIRSDVERWGKTIQAAGIKAE